MSNSFTTSEATTFTIIHARHMAAKVATNLKRIQRFYGELSDTRIVDYENEAIELLRAGYLGTVAYGFRRNGNWIEPTLKYTARELFGASANDDDPGRVRPSANISGATFYSFLTYSAAWDILSESEKRAFEKCLPFQRSSGSEPGVEGYFSDDRVYSAGGRALNRASVRKY